MNPWGMYAAGKKEKKHEPGWGRPVGCKARTGSTTGTLGGRYNQEEEKGSSGNGRWAGEPERGRWYGTLRALNRKPMVNNAKPKHRNTLRGTYAGDQYDASGRQRGTVILYMGPTGAISGTPKVDNVRSLHSSNNLISHSSNSLKSSLAESSAQRKRWKTSTPRYKKGGNEKERSRLTKTTTTRGASMMLPID